MTGYWINNARGASIAPAYVVPSNTKNGIAYVQQDSSFTNASTSNSRGAQYLLKPPSFSQIYTETVKPLTRQTVYLGEGSFSAAIPSTNWGGFQYGNDKTGNTYTLYWNNDTDRTGLYSLMLNYKWIRLAAQPSAFGLNTIPNCTTRAQVKETLQLYEDLYLKVREQTGVFGIPEMNRVIGIKPSTTGVGGTVSSTMKQNKHYAGIKTAGGGTGQDNYNIAGRLLCKPAFKPAQESTRPLQQFWATAGMNAVNFGSFMTTNHEIYNKTTTPNDLIDGYMPFGWAPVPGVFLDGILSGVQDYDGVILFNDSNFKVHYDNIALTNNPWRLWVPYFAKGKQCYFGDGMGYLDDALNPKYTLDGVEFDTSKPMTHMYWDGTYCVILLMYFSDTYISPITTYSAAPITAAQFRYKEHKYE